MRKRVAIATHDLKTVMMLLVPLGAVLAAILVNTEGAFVSQKRNALGGQARQKIRKEEKGEKEEKEEKEDRTDDLGDQVRQKKEKNGVEERSNRRRKERRRWPGASVTTSSACV